MSRYDKMDIRDFFREMLHRADGIATLVIAAIFSIIAALAPSLDLSVGRLSGADLSLSLAGLIPLVILYYVSLAYFSSSGRLSIAVNSVLVGLVPVLFFYFA